MSAEQNKALVRRFFEAHEGKADLNALDKMLAPDFVSHVRRIPGQQPDREGYKWAIAEYSAAFSDRRFLVQQQVAEGDTVGSYPAQHVRHLLLRHPRAQERHLELRQRRP
jgi:ketosteroid isomerase-like protein